MKNVKTISIILIIVAFIVAITLASFYIGVSVGKTEFKSSIETDLRLQILNDVSERLGEIPGNVMVETPKNIMYGTINAITANEVVIIFSPQTMKEAIWQKPQAYKLKIDKDTKVFYTTTNPNFIIDTGDSLTVDHPIKVTELKKDEYAYVQLDETQPAGQYKALEIRVAR